MTRDVDGNEVFRLVGLSPLVVQRIRERLKEDENAGPEFLRVCMRIAKPAKKPSVEEQPGRFEPPTPILGTYTLLDDGIQFKPRHPISRGAVVEVYGDIDGQLTQKLADLASGKLALV
ncbi:MAG: hypothetical protein NZM31_11235, partial [Gemmatales bacterium]|nr:hypothetical protein [Gemmatales bacterium]MDW8387570.1 hypothetical protein [Gemmatales bacterium]